MHNPPMIPRPGLLLVAAAVASIGCGSMTDDRPAKWSFISAAITQPSCATVNCHSAVAQRSGVDLHDRASGYTSLAMRGFATPADSTQPASAPLIYLLEAKGSTRMPPDVPLPAADIVLIESWIAAGAPND
jgi:hypothetical protein